MGYKALASFETRGMRVKILYDNTTHYLSNPPSKTITIPYHIYTALSLLPCSFFKANSQLIHLIFHFAQNASLTPFSTKRSKANLFNLSHPLNNNPPLIRLFRPHTLRNRIQRPPHSSSRRIRELLFQDLDETYFREVVAFHFFLEAGEVFRWE